MKYILKLIVFLSFNYAICEEYILEFQANVKIVREYDISNVDKFRSYQLIGTFTDEYGNYGKFDAVITSDIKDNKLIKLEGTAIYIYSNEEKLLAMVDDPIKYNDEVIFPDKVRIKLEYLEKWSVWLDIKIIFSTIFRLNY